MTDNSIYTTIKERCDGNIYIGVVGPVRSGKSTFIRKFLETVVLPNIENERDRERTLDEIPQSGSGKTITTTEPKFIPSEAVKINMGGTQLSARMIDCVGYMVDGAWGATEDGEERMVVTPWAEAAIPFSLAGEMGTERVVKEHSTIAMLVTTDGSICDIPRESYIPAEERAAEELKASGVPFAIILNCLSPETKEAHILAESLEEKYGAPVALVNCNELDREDAYGILSLVVGEFPIRELCFTIPDWCYAIPKGHRVLTELKQKIADFSDRVSKLSHIEKAIADAPHIRLVAMDAATGVCKLDMPLPHGEYYGVLKEMTGLELSDERALLTSLVELAEAKRDYDKIKHALTDAREMGYGIVMPSYDELRLSEPQLHKSATGYGIKVCASADSYHIIRTELKAEVCPVIGSEEQSEEVYRNMTSEYEEDPKRLLEAPMFGRSLYDLVNDGMNSKLLHIPEQSRSKLASTIERIMNEGAGGLICILL